jgi:hypothetical protein
MFPQDLGSLVGLTLTLAVLFLALLGVAAVVVARVALHRFLATRVRFMELAGPLVIYLAVTVAVFFLALWLLFPEVPKPVG